jgi:hypothetical protein
VPAQAIVASYIESFKDFPPRAKAASFTVSDVMEKMTTATSGKNYWQNGFGVESFCPEAKCPLSQSGIRKPSR